jgi:hypothetical protein
MKKISRRFLNEGVLEGRSPKRKAKSWHDHNWLTGRLRGVQTPLKNSSPSPEIAGEGDEVTRLD